MVLDDVTNKEFHRHTAKSRRLIEIANEIRAEQAVLQQVSSESAILRLQLQIRHIQYLQQEGAVQFRKKYHKLLHIHLQNKANLVSVRKSKIEKTQESYKAKVKQIRAREKHRQVRKDFESRQSMQRIEAKILESNKKSFTFLQLQQEDFQIAFLQTIRSLQSQVEGALSQNCLLEDAISRLQKERQQFLDSERARDSHFRRLVQKFTSLNLTSRPISALKEFVEQRCLKSAKAMGRARTLLHDQRLTLKTIGKQIRTFKAALRQIISERDELYQQFSYLIEKVSAKNVQLENESNERIRNLSQLFVMSDTNPNEKESSEVS